MNKGQGRFDVMVFFMVLEGGPCLFSQLSITHDGDKLFMYL